MFSSSSGGQHRLVDRLASLDSSLAYSTHAGEMSDAFFSKPRPFSKRKRDDAPAGAARAGRHGTSARGQSLSRGGKERQNGRGGSSAAAGGRQQNKGKRRADAEDEELDEANADQFDSDDVGSDDADGAEQGSEEEEDELETPAQKRLRLSQMYLKSLEKDKDGKSLARISLTRSLRGLIQAHPSSRGIWIQRRRLGPGHHCRAIAAGRGALRARPFHLALY